VEILVKSALGGLLIALLLSFARRGNYIVTGLLVSVPAISLYTWWWVGREEGRAAMWSAIPWVIYLFVVYLLAGRLPLWMALLCGVVSYLIFAAIFLVVLEARG
jgi:membrane protein GlpM